MSLVEIVITKLMQFTLNLTILKLRTIYCFLSCSSHDICSEFRKICL